MKTKIEKRYTIIRNKWERRGDICEFTDGYTAPRYAYKSHIRAQNQWKRLTRDWYISKNLSDFAEALDDIMDRRTYESLVEATLVNSIITEYKIPEFDAQLSESGNDASWRMVFSSLPDNVQFRYIKKFNILPYQVVGMDVEV